MASIYFTVLFLLFWDFSEIGKNVSIITSVISASQSGGRTGSRGGGRSGGRGSTGGGFSMARTNSTRVRTVGKIACMINNKFHYIFQFQLFRLIIKMGQNGREGLLSLSRHHFRYTTSFKV